MAAPERQENLMSEPLSTPITGVHTIGVPVTDQDRALAFYVGDLGFEKRLDAPVEQLGGRWIEVAPQGSAITIALVPARDDVPAGVETGIRFTTPDAAALHGELQARGVDVGELLSWPGVPPMFAVRDRDGNGLEVVEQA
jgi:catechol 2,3-dioxygenase-like lactoylglutathione lyase family enzyme